MLKMKKYGKVKALFAGFYKKQELNDLVKNFSVQSPQIQMLPRIRMRQSPTLTNSLSNLFRKLNLKYFSQNHQIVNYDLDQLNRKISFDMELDKITLYDWVDDVPSIEFETFDLRKALSTQSELLQSLINQQRLILRKEIEVLHQEQLTKLKNK